MYKKVALIMMSAFFAAGVGAQAVDATKDAGKAVAEGTKEGADKAKAGVESGSKRAVDKTKGAAHGAKARYHRHKAKQEAKDAVH